MEAQASKHDRGTLGVPNGQIPPTGAASAPNKGCAPADMTIASIKTGIGYNRRWNVASR